MCFGLFNNALECTACYFTVVYIVHDSFTLFNTDRFSLLLSIYLQQQLEV